MHSQLIYFNWTFNLKIYLTQSNNNYHKFYTEQMNLELEAVQSIYVQKNKEYWAWSDVDVFRQGVSGFSCT